MEDHPSSQINLLRCIIVIEQPNSEVTDKIGDEECPIILRHGVSSEVEVVDDVDPHVARIVGQVLTEFLRCVCRKVFPVRPVQCRSHGNLAVDTDLVQVCTACIVSKSALFLVLLLGNIHASARAFKDVGAQTGGVSRAVGTVCLIGQGVQRSNNECKRCLRVVNSSPLVVFFKGDNGIIVLSSVVDERLVRYLGQKLNLIDIALLLCNFGGNTPLFLDLIHALLRFLENGVGLLLTLPLCWYILFVSR